MPLTLEEKVFPLRRHPVALRVSPTELFTPNQTTKLFSDIVRINPGDVVFDIGSGVGPLAIWAALENASKVYSVEIVPEQCEVAKMNVQKHGLMDRIEVYCGDGFNPIPEGIKADVIISDVSGISEKIARALESKGISWYPDKVPTGGRDGTEVIGSVITKAGNYLNDKGRFYFPVAGLSNYKRLINLAEQHFTDLKVVTEVNFPLSPQQKETIEKYGEPGTYELSTKGTRLTWKGWIYEATNPISKP